MKQLTALSVWENAPQFPVDLVDLCTAASVEIATQALLNRTQYLYDNQGSIPDDLVLNSLTASSIKVGTYAVWHAGNFDPDNLSVTSLTAATLKVGSYDVWHAGNFNPADYAPTTALDSLGTFLSFRAQDFMHGGGTISWGVTANKLKWTTRFLLMPCPSTEGSNRYIEIAFRTSGVLNAVTGLECADTNGITLAMGDSLWAIHPRGNTYNDVTLKVVPWNTALVNDYFADDNAFLMCIRGEDSQIHFRNGVVIPSGKTASGGGAVQSQYTPIAHVGATGSTVHGLVVANGAAGFISGTDKAKLDGIATGANNYVHPSTDGSLHVPATGTTNGGRVLMAGPTASTFSWTAIPEVVPNGNSGYMTGADKAKLDALDSGDYAKRQGNITTTAGIGWFRIATNGTVTDGGTTGSTAFAKFTIRDNQATTHMASVTFIAGVLRGNCPVISILSHTYSGTRIFNGIRIVSGVGPEGAAIEVQMAGAFQVESSIYDNESTNGWTPAAWTAAPTPPTGFIYTEVNLNSLDPLLAEFCNTTGANATLSATNGFYVGRDGKTYGSTLYEGGTSLVAKYAPLTHVGVGGAEHPAAMAGGASGFMTGDDKTKLNGIANNANNYVHPSGDGNHHIPATGTANNRKVLMAASTAGSESWQALIATDITTALGFTPADSAGAVPPGTIVAYGGFVPPAGWLMCDGKNTYGMYQYGSLFNVLVAYFTGNVTLGSKTITGIVTNANLRAGLPVYCLSTPNHGLGFTAGATIESIVDSTTITVSIAATGTGICVGFYAPVYGLGSASDTFAVPDLRGRVPVGVDSTAGRLSSNDALGQYGGTPTVTLDTTQIPSHRHGAISNGGTGGGTDVADWSVGGATIQHSTNYGYTGYTGGGGAHNNLQPYQIVNYIIKY